MPASAIRSRPAPEHRPRANSSSYSLGSKLRGCFTSRMVLPLLLLLAVAGEPPAATAPAQPAFSSRRGGRLFVSPMGEPFRPSGRGDDTLADWFQQADRKQHGRPPTE